MLQPTDQTKIEEFYCAHDSHSGGGDSFHEAIAKVFKTIAIFIFISILFDFLIKVGEDDHWLGTGTESWGEVISHAFRINTIRFDSMMSAMMK